MTTDVEVQPDAMARAITDMAGILRQLHTAIGDLAALSVPTGSCGQVGAPVAGASADLHQQAVQAAGQLQATLNEASTRLECTLAGYHSDDEDIAAATRRLARLRPPTR
jgi:enamine deaminase RidA (YjgF/YER057c/UK114 family)